MTLGNKIAQYRKNLNITQDALAQQLGVTNQAVSKWESDQCCPDVTLLPKLADIFRVTIDELFGREVQPKEAVDSSEIKRKIHIFVGDSGNTSYAAPTPGWPDDNILRVAVYVGHKMVCGGFAEKGYQFSYEGDVDGVLSCISVTCGDVHGDVDSGRDITCGNVEGSVDAGRDVNCGDVEGSVDAGRTVCCGNVDGDVDAGTSVSCGNVEGDVDAGSYVGCGQVGGGVDAGTDVKCGDVFGDVDAGGNVECTRVEGDIDAGGNVTVRK